MPCWLNSLEALRIMGALVSAASSFDFRIARSTPSQQCLAPAILDVRHHLLSQIWAKKPSSRVRSSVSRVTEDSASFRRATADGRNVSDPTVFLHDGDWRCESRFHPVTFQ